MKITRLVSVLALMFAAVAGAAAQLVADSMEPTMDVLPASRQRTDLNGQVCAVVRVLLPVEGVTFEGSVIGDTPFITNHYWVYMPPGEKMLGINCPGAKPLRVNFHSLGISGGLQSRIIYDLNINGYPTSGSTLPVTLNITFTPENATVLIDSEIMETSGGKMSTTLEEGNHEYTIAARGYLTAEGVLSLRQGRMSNFRFDLEKAAAKPAPIATDSDTTPKSTPTASQAEQWYTEGMKHYHEKNYAKALSIIHKAAEAGDYTAQFMLGQIYHSGTGAERNFKSAAEWYSKSAYQGCADAQYWLGYLYEVGQGVTQDYKTAAEWYEKAAEQDHQEAQLSLGNLYVYGRGVPKNYKTAVIWFEKSAEQGNIKAQYRLAVCYNNGEGIEKDHKKAFSWYIKAAKQGYKYAQDKVGYKYENGVGVPQDYKTAAEWYVKAIDNGSIFAAKRLLQDKFKPYLTAEQLERVKKAAEM